MEVSRFTAAKALSAAAVGIVTLDFATIVVGGIRAGDYAYDSAGDVLGSVLFSIVVGGLIVAPVIVAARLLGRQPARPFPASWAPVGAQAGALVVIVGMILGIRASDSSTAALGYVVLPFYAGGAAFCGYWLLRLLGQARARG